MITILLAGITLVIVGLVAIAATRNIVKIVMGLQSMNLGVLLLLSISALNNLANIETIILLAAVAATASEAVSISLIVAVYKKLKTTDPRKISKLKW